jgi:hypothetical protein
MWQPLSVFASGNEGVNHQIQNDRPLIAANSHAESQAQGFFQPRSGKGCRLGQLLDRLEERAQL